MNPESRCRLAAIAERWDDVEKRMKEVEQLRGEAIYAAINELRYTGRKLADVLLLESGDDANQSLVAEQIVIAENYLINADHDLTDAAVLFVSLRVKRIFEIHGRAK